MKCLFAYLKPVRTGVDAGNTLVEVPVLRLIQVGGRVGVRGLVVDRNAGRRTRQGMTELAGTLCCEYQRAGAVRADFA